MLLKELIAVMKKQQMISNDGIAKCLKEPYITDEEKAIILSAIFYQCIHPGIGSLLNDFINTRYSLLNGNTPLTECASKGNVHCIKQLFKLKDITIKIDYTNSKGRTPLMQAANANQVEVFELLMMEGAKINLIDDEKHTALDLALKKQHFEIVAIILNKGRVLGPLSLLHLIYQQKKMTKGAYECLKTVYQQQKKIRSAKSNLGIIPDCEYEKVKKILHKIPPALGRARLFYSTQPILLKTMIEQKKINHSI